MAIMSNSANITYNYAGQTSAAISNIATTNLIEDYSLKAEKLSHNNSWRPSENLTYVVKIENDGTEPIFAISIQDDLGGNPDRLLTFVSGSIKMNRNGNITPITPTSTSPLTMVLPNTLEPGETAAFTYIAKVNSDIDAAITEITNEVTVVGHELSESGPVITVTPNPSVTLPKANYAEIRIEKSVDKDSAAVGDKLTYIFRLENSGNIEATGVVIRDNLPEKFSIESIQSETNGIVTVFETTDYSVDANNRLILPTSVIKTIFVPPATSSGSGVTTVTIAGEITA